MSAVRSKNTGLERQVFRLLRRRKVYFQCHYDKIPGKPDIALPSKKLAVFIDGDFWHGRNFAQLKLKLKNEFWLNKISATRRRDRRNGRLLRGIGWKVKRVWGNDFLKDPESMADEIEAFLCDPGALRKTHDKQVTLRK